MAHVTFVHYAISNPFIYTIIVNLPANCGQIFLTFFVFVVFFSEKRFYNEANKV